MPNPQNRNDRRKGEERSETLIIPHITKEMLETARRMAEAGASRAEIEQAIVQVAGVREVAVVARKHPMLDEVPVAFIIPQGGHNAVAIDMVLTLIRSLTK